MLLQAVRSAAACKGRTCYQVNRREEGVCNACSDRGFSNLNKTQLCKDGCDRLIHSVGRTQTCRQLPYYRLRTAGLRSPVLSIKKTVLAAAINQGSSQHGDLSNQGSPTASKPPTVSSKNAELVGPGSERETTKGDINLDSVHLLNKSVIHSEQRDSGIVESNKLTECFTNFKTWWTAIHDAYKEDTATWGYGTSPIFRVYLGPSGQIERVIIDEDEIQRRQYADDLIPSLDSSGNKEQAHQKIMLARRVAKDLESGKKDFNKRSTVFAVVQHPNKYENLTGRQKLLKQIDIAVHRAAPVVKGTLMIAIPVYGIFILTGAYLLVTKDSEMNSGKEEESAARLEKMKKLKAQMSTYEGNTNAKHPSVAPFEFMQKLHEVREMARKVRAEEGAQNLVEASDTKVDEYQPKLPGSPVMTLSSLGGNISTEFGGNFDMDMGENEPEVQNLSETIGGKLNKPTLEDVKVPESVVNITNQPVCKQRPRIITSLEEAMAILGNKESNDSENAGRLFSDEKPQSKHTASTPHDESLASNDSVSISIKPKELKDSLEKKAGRILATNSGEQDREKWSMEGDDDEVLVSDMKSRQDLSYTGTLHNVDSEGRSPEGQALEPRLNNISENGQLEESEVFLMSSRDEVKQLAYKNQYDEVSSKVISSTCLDEVGTQDGVSRPILRMEPDEVVGSGQPLHKRIGSRRAMQQGPTFSNTKRWSKELQRKYDLERDPEIRELMKEIGSELDSWLTEEEIEETASLAEKLEDGDVEYVQRNYKRIQKQIKEEKERFGLDAVLKKYKEYQPKAADELWWLDLHCVLSGHDGICTIIDRFSKQAHFVPVKKTVKPDHLARLFVAQIFRLHGMPETIASDRDPRFTSLFWKAIWENIGISLQFSSSFHPQTDGQSDIADSVVLDLLTSYISDQKTQWERYLPLVEFAYNNMMHSSTGKAPFEIVQGAMKAPPFLSTKDKILEANEYTRDLDTAFAKVRETLQKSQERQKKAADRH
ncbi:hypothetical protein L7F22_048016 [Adiantum nelumboides]|nr:hypothetical protein [Adiantum nelumboides]